MTSTEDVPSGERFVPETMGGQLLEAEHVARYRLAAELAHGHDVLDAGCGVGWGAQLLLDAGAARVRGVDIDPGAIDDARSRVPGAEFAEGDLAALPYDDDAFDMVVCFEALEHTRDPGETLDELRRVLAPGGLLLVSSPNPRVYPAGNPFHIRELTPEELAAEVGARFAHSVLFHQHLLIASAILPPHQSGTMLDAAVGVLDSIEAKETDPYSVAIASDRPLPAARPAVMMSPSDQLTDLGPAWAAVVEARAAVDEESARIAAAHAEHLRAMDAERAQWRAGEARTVSEREQILAERRSLYEQLDALTARRDELQAHADGLSAALADARSHADNVAVERDRAVAERAQSEAERAQVEAERDRLATARDDLAAERDRLASERDRLAGECDRLTGQRDRLGALLIDSEQALAGITDHYSARQDQSAAQLASAEQAAERYRIDAEELGRVRATLGWRAIQPLRRVRAHVPWRLR